MAAVLLLALAAVEDNVTKATAFLPVVTTMKAFGEHIDHHKWCTDPDPGKYLCAAPFGSAYSLMYLLTP